MFVVQQYFSQALIATQHIIYVLDGILLFIYFIFPRWLNFEKVIDTLIAQNIYHTNVELLQTYARDLCFIEDEDEFHTMLNFYHDLGMIVRHQSTVVLKAQWLIDLFRHLITIPHFDKTVRKLDVL